MSCQVKFYYIPETQNIADLYILFYFAFAIMIVPFQCNTIWLKQSTPHRPKLVSYSFPDILSPSFFGPLEDRPLKGLISHLWSHGWSRSSSVCYQVSFSVTLDTIYDWCRVTTRSALQVVSNLYMQFHDVGILLCIPWCVSIRYSETGSGASQDFHLGGGGKAQKSPLRPGSRARLRALEAPLFCLLSLTIWAFKHSESK